MTTGAQDMTRRGSARRPLRERGIALILTLLVLTILIILVAQLRVTARLNVVQARNFTGDLQNVYGVRAGLEFARLYIQVDTELAANIDTLHEPWARPFLVPDVGEASVEVKLEDEERRLNLSRLVQPDGKPNPAVRAQLAKLVAVLGIPDAKVGDRIADYVDPDSEGEFEVAAKNRMLVIPEEMGMIPGVRPEYLYGGFDEDARRPYKGLLDFVSLWPIPRAAPGAPEAGRDIEGQAQPPPAPPPPGSRQAPAGDPPPAGARQQALPEGTQPPTGLPPPPTLPRPAGPPPIAGTEGPPRPRYGVNVNTAPMEVLVALSPEMTPDIAQAMIAYREATDSAGNPYSFTDIPDLYKVQGMQERMVESIKNEIVFRSQVFSARVTSRSRNVMRRSRWILERGQPGMPPRLLTWWEEGGAFGLPQPPVAR